MYITSVELTDFRSHRHLVFSFVDGVNALIGPSNSGKTNVMRALRWCLTNQPNGTDMIRIGAKEAKVVTHLSNGFSIERVRGKTASNNFYRLYRDGELVEEFTGFGKNVPKKIHEAHNMSLDGSNSMNFHDQLETAFLVASSPSERASYIGNLEELAKVDRASTGLNEELRDRSKEVKRMDQDISALELEIERLRSSLSVRRSVRDSLELMLEALEEENRHLATMEGHIVTLGDIRARLDKASQIVESYKAASVGFPEDFAPEQVNRLFALTKEAQLTRERLAEIKEVAEINVDNIEEYHVLVEGSLMNVERLDELSERLDSNRRRQLTHIPYLSDEVANIVLHDFKDVDDNIESHRAMFRHHANLLQIDERRQALSVEATELNEANDHLLDEMLSLLVKAGHCTTCGQRTENLTHDCIEQTI